jgi:hypothetical protein
LFGEDDPSLEKFLGVQRKAVALNLPGTDEEHSMYFQWPTANRLSKVAARCGSFNDNRLALGKGGPDQSS